MMSYFDLHRWIYGGCALLGLAASSAAPGAIIAHYKFDEPVGASTAVNEVTDNGGNGAVGASVVLGVAGMDGTAVQLPKVNSLAGVVDMGNASGIFSKITASGQLTLSYWLKGTSTVNPNNRNVAVSLGSTANNNSYVDSGMRGDVGFVGAAYGRNRANKTNPIDIGDLAGPAVNNNEFHHIALTVDLATKTGSFYVDGVLAISETNTLKYAAFPAFNDFEVGRLVRSSPADPFGGVVDDLQLYDRALAGSEVQFLFDNPGQTIPEPAAVVLSALGLAAVACCRRRGVTC